MAAKKIFVVTGANKGIGYAIVRTLARQIPDSIIYLTARNVQLGKEAKAKIDAELAGQAHGEIIFHQLDITNEDSCATFAAHLRQAHSQIDVLINNAGFAYKQDATESPAEQAKVTNDINYYGTKRVSQHLQPLIRDGGRVVNVCSTVGKLCPFEIGGRNFDAYGEKWIKEIGNDNVTEAQIDAFVEAYKKAAADGTRKEQGFPESAYRVSKTAEIAYTLLQHRLLKSRNIIVNACCPGYVATDMTSNRAPLTIDQGADTPVFLATAPDVPNGELVASRKPTRWH